MTSDKSAELRSLKKKDELEATNVERCPKRPSLLSLLQAMLMFVGGFGRVLKFVEDVVEWWNDLS